MELYYSTLATSDRHGARRADTERIEMSHGGMKFLPEPKLYDSIPRRFTLDKA